MIRRPPRSTPLYSSAASDVYKRQLVDVDVFLTNALHYSYWDAFRVDLARAGCDNHLLDLHGLISPNVVHDQLTGGSTLYNPLRPCPLGHSGNTGFRIYNQLNQRGILSHRHDLPHQALSVQ